jgi:DNA-binding LytR/AlgR family response regulator
MIPLRLLGVAALVIAAVISVNISSDLIENPPGHRSFALWEPFCWEISSAIGFIALLPVVWFVYSRLHWRRLGAGRFIAAQVVCAVAYSLLHVAIMVAMRHLVYLAMGGHYDFSHHNLPLYLIYEGRKDALSWALIMAIFWTWERVTSRPPQSLPDRIEVRGDGRTVWLAPIDILCVEAAGNYVELHVTQGKPLLLRGTLTEFETRLAPYGFARVHRSRLVNRGHIRSFAATPSGDLTLTLSDGRDLTASRRYRSAVDRI